MQIKFDKLWVKLESMGMNKQQFQEKTGITGSTYMHLLTNHHMNTKTICRVCDALDCTPDEIMEWIPEKEIRKYEEEKIKSQIAELQAKLKQLD